MTWWLRILYGFILGAEVFSLAPFAVALSRRQHIPYAFKPLFYFVLFQIINWQISWYGKVYLHNNLFCFHLATFFQITLLSVTYYRLIPQRIFRVAVWVFYVIFVFIALIDAVYFHYLMSDTNIYARSFGNFVVISYALYNIFILTNETQLPIEKRPEFLLAVAVIFYYSTPFVSTLIQSYLQGRTRPEYLDYLALLPFVLSSWISMTLLSFMFMRFPLDHSPREALPEWLRWRRKRPVRLSAGGK